MNEEKPEEEKKPKEEKEEGEAGTAIAPDIERLRVELDAKIKEVEENRDKFLRKCADLENYKKRVEKEISDLLNFANEELLKALLPVIDNLERALEHSRKEKKEAGELDALMNGVELTLKNMADVLKKFGVSEIKSEGERFDPQRHEALGHEESERFEGETVIKELQKGYLLKDRLLRPSLVIVSKKPQNKEG